jgi:hypothetical protein
MEAAFDHLQETLHQQTIFSPEAVMALPCQSLGQQSFQFLPLFIAKERCGCAHQTISNNLHSEIFHYGRSNCM